MKSENNQEQRAQQILGEALKHSRDARSAYLETVCGGDSDLRREVESLLKAEGQAGTFLFPRPPESVQLMRSLLFAFAAGIFVFNIAGCEQKASRGYHLHALFHNVHQVKIGDPVKLAGIQIGGVESIALDPTNGMWHVTMRVKRSAIVKADSVAAIRSGVIPGESFIALDGGSPWAVAAADGTYLANIETPTAREAALAVDVGCENLLKARLGPPPDALDWAKRNPTMFSEGASLESLLASLAGSGAQGMVVITNLLSYDYLIIVTLPAEVALRQKVFASDARLRQVCGLEPAKDYGQRYLSYPFVSKR